MEHRILIVESNDLVRESIRETLATVGFAVHMAVGEDAMAVLAEYDIDLVLTERVLPDVDGFSLLWCIKTDYPDVPVIVMTASDDFAVIVEAMRLGAHDYLVKPFDAATLVDTVRVTIAANERVAGRSSEGWQHDAPLW